jgi:adenylate kinase
MDAGSLVPNDVVVEMVTARLASPDAASGWLLDGYPRSAEQADAIEAAGVRPDVFVLVECPDDVLVERVVGRRLDPVTGDIYHMKFKPPPADIVGRLTQRSDDTEEALRARLASHHANVAAVLSYYEDVLVTVDGTGSMEEVFGVIDAALEGARGGKVEAAAA